MIRNRYSDEFVVKAIKRYLAGETIKEVAKDLRISYVSVADWLRATGIKLRPNAFSKRDWNKIRKEIDNEIH